LTRPTKGNRRRAAGTPETASRSGEDSLVEPLDRRLISELTPLLSGNQSSTAEAVDDPAPAKDGAMIRLASEHTQYMNRTQSPKPKPASAPSGGAKAFVASEPETPCSL
jgi:hypothetical protein